MNPNGVRTRCAKCGRIALTAPRQAHCHHRAFGKGSYACWGELAPVRKPREKTLPSEAQRVAARGAGFRQKHAKAAARAVQAIKDKHGAMLRLEHQIAAWEKRERSAARKAAMTDEQIEAVRQRAQVAAQASARIQAVRRRLMKSAGGEPEPIKMVRAGHFRIRPGQAAKAVTWVPPTVVVKRASGRP